jgi:hypothetical protein
VPSRECLQVIDFCFLSVSYPWFIYVFIAYYTLGIAS